MIRLRQTLERGRAHPILGPFVVILLVLLLAMMFMHAAHDSQHASVEFGAICISIAMFLGMFLLQRVRESAPTPLLEVRGDRGPPSAALELSPGFAAPGSSPLRR